MRWLWLKICREMGCPIFLRWTNFAQNCPTKPDSTNSITSQNHLLLTIFLIKIISLLSNSKKYKRWLWKLPGEPLTSNPNMTNERARNDDLWLSVPCSVWELDSTILTMLLIATLSWVHHPSLNNLLPSLAKSLLPSLVKSNKKIV